MVQRKNLFLFATGFAVLAGLAASIFLLPTPQKRFGPATVHIATGAVDFRPIGNFQHDGKAATPSVTSVPVAAFDIMAYQVSRAVYRACVQAGACTATDTTGHDTLPQTHVNWIDATAFADWLSDETGEVWRLPTAQEWQRAAAERFGDAAPDAGDLDPGARMLTQYARGTLLRGRVNRALRPAGGYGVNSLGVADMSGNIWEWTDGCMLNGTLDSAGRVSGTEPYCGVRVAGGAHRAAVIYFVRDPSVGGCAVGLPPDYLGFRLVRER